MDLIKGPINGIIQTIKERNTPNRQILKISMDLLNLVIWFWCWVDQELDVLRF